MLKFLKYALDDVSFCNEKEAWQQQQKGGKEMGEILLTFSSKAYKICQ